MPNHLTAHLSPTAQALAERLAVEGPTNVRRLSDADCSAFLALQFAGVAHQIGGGMVALTMAGAVGYTAAKPKADSSWRTVREGTTADRIAARFGNDGRRWHENGDSGAYLPYVCRDEGGVYEMGGYTFEDGSAILTHHHNPGTWEVAK